MQFILWKLQTSITFGLRVVMQKGAGGAAWSKSWHACLKPNVPGQRLPQVTETYTCDPPGWRKLASKGNGASNTLPVPVMVMPWLLAESRLPPRAFSARMHDAFSSCLPNVI
jgi:hypothetical protein